MYQPRQTRRVVIKEDQEEPLVEFESHEAESIEIEVFDDRDIVVSSSMAVEAKEYAESSTQTGVEDLDLTEIYAKYPQFKDKDKVELIKDLLAKEEKIKELELKLEKFTTAMSAFKMLMNP